MKASIWIPTSLPSVANIREHWGSRGRRARKHRRDAALLCRAATPWRLLDALRAAGGTITLTVVGQRRRDDDNLAAACKAIRDGIADGLRMDDGNQLLRWRYEQRPVAAAPRLHADVLGPGVEVLIESTE